MGHDQLQHRMALSQSGLSSSQSPVMCCMLGDECLKHSDYTRISLAFSYCFGIIYIVLGVRSLI